MSGLIGKKLGMTSIFDTDGKAIPCTVLEAGPCVVTQVKTEAKDGYSAIQLAFGEKRMKSTTKALQGHFANAKTSPKSRIAEFKFFEKSYELGETISANLFEEGEFVDVSGTSTGKGFQGVVKRHGFSGVGGQTHGQHNRGRAPGSLGASSFPSRVFKGMRMAGQTGNVTVKIQNLKVVKVISDRNLILIKGSIPGKNGSYVTIEK